MAPIGDVEKPYNDKEYAVEPTSPESPKIEPYSDSDLDDNYRLYKRHAGEQLDPEEAKKVLRKVDFRIVPILFLIYLLQYLDKNALNFSAVFGLEEGLKLEGQDYSWLGSVSTDLAACKATQKLTRLRHLLFRLPCSSVPGRLCDAKATDC